VRPADSGDVCVVCGGFADRDVCLKLDIQACEDMNPCPFLVDSIDIKSLEEEPDAWWRDEVKVGMHPFCNNCIKVVEVAMKAAVASIVAP